MKRFLVLPLLAVVPLLPVKHAIARTSSGITVSTTDHGIRLTLSLPRRSFARNSLVQLAVRLQNTSNNRVYLSNDCTLQNPAVSVQSLTHKTVYPPALTFPSVPTNTACRSPLEIAVTPNGSISRNYFIILRGQCIHAVVRFSRGRSDMVSRPLHVGLVSSAPQRVNLHIHPLYATVVPPRSGKRLLLYTDWFQCASSSLRDFGGTPSWQFAHSVRLIPSTSLAPSCKVVQWHVVTGYLNHPVVAINFKSP
jgi:hypothetical protein